MDAGGGDGTLLAALLRAYPRLRGTLLERPAALAAAPPGCGGGGRGPVRAASGRLPDGRAGTHAAGCRALFARAWLALPPGVPPALPGLPHHYMLEGTDGTEHGTREARDGAAVRR
ncbi:hypothetical protein ACHZ98_20385 [Streptomyces sp. MAR4 CNY-716]